MTYTSLILVTLVVIGLAFTRGRATSAKKAGVPLLDRGVYAALIVVAIVLAYLWHS
jgi:hypothetical protein